ncbi:MAG: hypothetical protein ACFE9L_00185 [Candidatus Hodarchaeota archaeon]
MDYGTAYDGIIETTWDFIDRILQVRNGDWILSKTEGLREYSTMWEDVSLTIHPDYEPHQYLVLSWQEYPAWTEQRGEEFRTWNDSNHDSDRYTYFKGKQGDEFDTFNFKLEILPYFIAKDRTQGKPALISELLNQWQGFVSADVSQLPTLGWHPSEETWTVFKEQLFENVAYSTSSFSADLITFHPAWIGEFYYPNSFEKWNGTEWVDRVPLDGENYAYGSSLSPFNASSGQMSSNYQYYAKNTLNTRRTSLAPLIAQYEDEGYGFTYENDSSDVDLSFEVRYKLRDSERLFRHTEEDWTTGNYQVGNLTVSYRFKYALESDVRGDAYYLQLFEFKWEFCTDRDVFRIETTIKGIENEGEATPGFTLPIVIQTGLICSVLLWLVRKRK